MSASDMCEAWLDRARAKTGKWIRMGIKILRPTPKVGPQRWRLFEDIVWPYVKSVVGPTQPQWERSAKQEVWRTVEYHVRKTPGSN
eukprot:m51a1_g12778 hypothetical protein (86) ;mRNA; r:2975-3465